MLAALTVGLIWTILELTPKSALLWFFTSAGSICEAMKQSNPWTNKQMISHQTRSGVDASLCFALENLFAQPAVFCTVRKMEMKLLCYVCARIRIATLNPTTPLINHWWNNWHDIKKVSKDRNNEFLSITKRVGIISYGALSYTLKKMHWYQIIHFFDNI